MRDSLGHCPGSSVSSPPPPQERISPAFLLPLGGDSFFLLFGRPAKTPTSLPGDCTASQGTLSPDAPASAPLRKVERERVLAPPPLFRRTLDGGASFPPPPTAHQRHASLPQRARIFPQIGSAPPSVGVKSGAPPFLPKKESSGFPTAKPQTPLFFRRAPRAALPREPAVVFSL